MGLIASGMARRGYDVHVAYLDRGDNAEDAELDATKLHPIKADSNYDVGMLFCLLSAVRREKPDIIQTWSPQMDIIGAIIARLTKAKWIMMEPTSPLDYANTWKSKLRNLLAGKAVVVSNSASADAYWQNRRTFKTHVIRNGQQFRRILDVPPYDIQNLPVSDSDVILLYVGRFNKTANAVKNFKTCIDTVALLSSNMPIKLLVCGDGTERSFWENKVIEAGLYDKVIFLGYLKREDVWGIMKIATALLTLSYFEGCPNVVQEAIFCKCPVIASDIPGHREILTEGEALLVDHKSPLEVGKAVIYLLSRKDRTAERVAQAFKIAETWSIDNMLDQYEDLYIDLFDNTHK
jgi:glycosyltransferase involved in cell wall biosynthesis